MKARENPFRSEKIESIPYIPLTISIDEILKRFEGLSYRAVIVGHEGSGKTTLLDTLEPHLRDAGFGVLRLHVRDTGASAEQILAPCGGLSGKRMLCIDGAEQIRDRAWRKILSALWEGDGILAASHKEAMLPTLVRCETNTELMDTLFARVMPGAGESDRELARMLLVKYSGNVRLVFRELYDRAGEIQDRLKD